MKSIRLFILLLIQFLTVFAQHKLIKVSKWSSYGSWPPSEKYVALVNIKSLDPIDLLHDLRKDLNDLINGKDQTVFNQSPTVNSNSNQQSSLPSVNPGSPKADKIQTEVDMPPPPAVAESAAVIPPVAASRPVSKNAVPSEMPQASNKKAKIADKPAAFSNQVSEPVLNPQRNIANTQSNSANTPSFRTSTNANIPNQSQLNKEPFRAIRS